MTLTTGGVDDPAQPVRHDPHDLKGKAGIALNQGEKMRAVDRGQQAIGPGYGAGHARLIVNQRHFAEDIARVEGFEQLLAGSDIDLAFDDDVERITRFTLLKNGLATGEGAVVFWRVDRIGIALHETVPRRGAVRRDRRSQSGVSRTTIIISFSVADFARFGIAGEIPAPEPEFCRAMERATSGFTVEVALAGRKLFKIRGGILAKFIFL